MSRKSDDADARQSALREHKSFDFKLENIEGRTIEGYASTFGNIDLGNDIIHAGAFRKTLIDRGHKVKFLWQHDMDEPLGKVVELREDARGLYFKAVISDTQRGRDALALLQDGAIEGISIGYEAVKGGIEYEKAADGRTLRHLKELKLYEFSLVTFPMNELAEITALKEQQRSQMQQAQGRLAAAYKEMTASGPVRRVGDMIAGYMRRTFNGYVDDMLIAGKISQDEHTVMSDALMRAIGTLNQSIPVDIAQRALDADEWGWMMGWMSDDPADESKAGRVLSRRNAERLEAALENLSAILAELQTDSAETAESDDAANDEQTDADETESSENPAQSASDNESALQDSLLLIEQELAELESMG